MHDFGRLVYLDVHKTGSSYVSSFLKNTCILPELSFQKHDWIKDHYDPKNFYFITIRHPHSMYSSLYRYGLDKKGLVYELLKRFGKLSAYEDFSTFMEFVLNTDNAKYLGYGYDKEIAEQLGLMSFRFLKLSLQYPHKKINYCLQKNIPLENLENNFIQKLEIKNEKLSENLYQLSTKIIPQYFCEKKVNEFMDKDLTINSSSLKHSEIVTDLDSSVRDRFLRVESLLLKRY